MHRVGIALAPLLAAAAIGCAGPQELERSSAGMMVASGLHGAEGTISLTVGPRFSTEPFARPIGDDQTILDFGDATGTERLWWQGTSDDGALVLSIGAEIVARFHPRAREGAVWDVRIEWGGDPRRAHLVVDGVACVRGSAVPRLPFAKAGSLVAVGQDLDHSEPFDGTIRDVRIEPSRWRAGRRIAVLGDSLTQDPTNVTTSRLVSWSRALGALLAQEEDGVVWNAGKNSDTFTLMAARVQDEVLAERPDAVVVFGGINDVVADVPLEHLKADAAALYAAIAAAGVPVVAVTILPFGDSAHYDARRESVRSGFNRWLLSRPRDVQAVWDAAALMTTPGSRPATLRRVRPDPWAYFDGLHLSDAGLTAFGRALWASGVLDELPARAPAPVDWRAAAPPHSHPDLAPTSRWSR